TFVFRGIYTDVLRTPVRVWVSKLLIERHGRMSSTRVVIVEDNDIMQLGLKTFIADLSDYRLAGTFSTINHLYRHLDEHGADILILDDSMPSLDTADILRYLRFNYATLKVIVFGTDLYAPLIREYLAEGALAYIYKEEQLRHCLAEGLNAVQNGTVYISHQASMLLINPANHIRPLPKRAFQVLKAMAEGLGVAQIAKRLNVTKKAVYSAQDRLREHFNVRRN